MDKINLGRIEVFFHQNSLDTQRHSVPNRSGHLVFQVVTLKEAQQMVGFKIWQPAYLPFAGMQLDKVQIVGTNGAFDTVVLKYKKDSIHWLVIRQQLISESSNIRRIPIGFSLRRNTVNNRPAALFNHTVTATAQVGGQLELLSCLWERGNFLMELEAPHLSDQVAIQIAESIH